MTTSFLLVVAVVIIIAVCVCFGIIDSRHNKRLKLILDTVYESNRRWYEAADMAASIAKINDRTTRAAGAENAEQHAESVN